MADENPAAQRQTAVTAYFSSKQLLLFVFARRSVCQYSMAEENPAAQRQTAVAANYCYMPLFGRQWQAAVAVDFSNKQLLLFAFARQ